MKKFFTNIFIFFISFFLLTIIPCCKKEERIPVVPVYFYINLDGATSGNIKVPGNYLYIDGEGYGGIVLYCAYIDEYIAYDRNCTYNPSNEKAILDVDSTKSFLECRDCGSKFRIQDGIPSEGPAKYSLIRYSTSLNNSILTIYNSQ